MELNLLHVHGSQIGYGRYGVELTKALKAMGVDVFDELPTADYFRQEWLQGDGAWFPPDARSKVCKVVAWISTPTHARGWFKDQVPVISTMWEATSLPESFRENLHEFAIVVVPSQQNLELFGRYHDNVKLVPLGIDPQTWHYTPRRLPEMYFDFLIAGSGPRKGTDLAYKAFRKVFRTWPRGGPVPRLVMKSPRGEEYRGERVEIIGGRISAEEEVDLYARAHCYLQPSRGEGFGLQPLQAIAQGCPTILTSAHGHEAFADLGWGLSSELSKSAYFIFGDAGDWWEPDFDELCQRMEYVYHHYSAACAIARHSAEVVARRFTWDHTAKGFVEAIGPDVLEQEAPTGGDWYEPIPRRYLVVLLRDWACDIAGAHYQFRRGERYFELADVKRILFEAGLLDPVCLRAVDEHGNPCVDDLGLAPHQLERLGDYSAAHSYCQLCGTKLGTGVQRADVLEAELGVGG